MIIFTFNFAKTYVIIAKIKIKINKMVKKCNKCFGVEN